MQHETHFLFGITLVLYPTICFTKCHFLYLISGANLGNLQEIFRKLLHRPQDILIAEKIPAGEARQVIAKSKTAPIPVVDDIDPNDQNETLPNLKELQTPNPMDLLIKFETEGKPKKSITSVIIGALKAGGYRLNINIIYNTKIAILILMSILLSICRIIIITCCQDGSLFCQACLFQKTSWSFADFTE